MGRYNYLSPSPPLRPILANISRIPVSLSFLPPYPSTLAEITSFSPLPLSPHTILANMERNNYISPSPSLHPILNNMGRIRYLSPSPPPSPYPSQLGKK